MIWFLFIYICIFRYTKYCTSFIKVAHLNSKGSNFVETICEVQCPGTNQLENRTDPFSIRLHPIIPLHTKVRVKLEYWKQRKQENHPIKIILLNLDFLSRDQFSEFLPKSMKLMEDIGFVDMKGHSLIGGDPISNYIGSLTGLSQEDWDEGCGYSEMGHFMHTCPWIWKDFGKARYITAYFDDSSFEAPRDSFGRPQVHFAVSPTDYYVGQDFNKLLVSSHCSFQRFKYLLCFSALNLKTPIVF